MAIATKKVAAKAPVKTKAKVIPIKKVGTMVKSTKAPAKATKDMTPLEKARIARANGTAKPKAKAKKNALPTFEAPADFKPHFLEVSLRTEKDGLLGSQIKATRYVGRYDPNADDKKKFDLMGYDPVTMIGIMSRFSAVTFKATNDKKYPADLKERMTTEKFTATDGEKKTRLVHRAAMRLPANTSFKLLLRINRKAADGSISVIVKSIAQGVKSAKTGRMSAVDLEKNDPVYRAFRKASRILPAAFKTVLMPPKKVRGKKVEADADEE
jgi:hypothetical protein